MSKLCILGLASHRKQGCEAAPIDIAAGEQTVFPDPAGNGASGDAISLRKLLQDCARGDASPSGAGLLRHDATFFRR